MAFDGASQLARVERLKAERSQHDERWERMAPYLAPSRVGIQTTYSKGANLSPNVYDSTMMLAAEMMAMFIAGHTTNPSQQWFGLRPRNPELARIDSVREWCEESRDRLLHLFTASPFYAEMPESLIDYGGFGTGFLLMDEAPQPINRVKQGFRGLHVRAEKTGRFLICEGADGMVDTAYREFEVSARVALGLWKDGVSESVRTKARTKPDEMVKMIHGIVPRPSGERSSGAKGMPWASLWIERESKAICAEGGYRRFPAAVPRYQKTPGDVYGRGRGDLAFSDTWTLNTAKRMALEDWALKIQPPILAAHDSVLGSIKLIPAGLTSVRTSGRPMRDVLAPWETGSHPEVSQIKEEELRRSIREVFYVDSIRQLMEVNKSEMTAFEFQKKIELLFRLMGPVYGRLEWEGLTQIVEMAFDLAWHGGVFSPPPVELLQAGGTLDVEFLNPIAKAQRSGDAEALLLAVNDLSPLTPIYPQMWDRLDPDKMALGVFSDVRGVPARWTRNDEEMAALRAARQEQDAAQQQQQSVAMAAQAAGDAAPMVKALTEKTQPGGA